MFKRFILTLSSAFGLGYAPKAPGTFGTLAALPLWWLLANLSLPVFVLAVVAITLFSIWVAHHAEAIYGGHDVQHIVIDEVAGMLVTVIGVPFAWPQVVAAFVVFRLLDALKPPPIRWFDDHVEGGLGVVIDDVVAGVVGCLILHLTRWLLGGWW
jgi:phosphatidylglycerophosphatase A